MVMSDELDGYPATPAISKLITAIQALPELIEAANLAMDALMNADPGNPKDATGWANDESFDAWIALHDALTKARGDAP